MEKLTAAQEIVFERFADGEARSAYKAKASLTTLRAMVRKGFLKDVTPYGPGGMFSPRTHFVFKKVK